ncbi:MAG: hypothetical protein ACYDCQ_12305, partial [Dehalococcoidia bacterium]
MEDGGQADYWQRLRQRSVNRRRVVRGGAAFAAGGIALGLVGCGGSSRTAQRRFVSTGASPAVAAALGPGAGTATPVRAGSLKTGGVIQGVTTDADANLDPVTNTRYLNQQLAGFHYSRLFRFSSGADPNVSL